MAIGIIRICEGNLADATSTLISATDTTPQLPLRNLQDPRLGRHTRLLSRTAWLQFDFGVNTTIGIVCLQFARHTDGMPLAGTVRHTFDADGGTPGAGAVHDSGNVPIGTYEGYGYHHYEPSAAVSARYWRVTFDVSGVSYIDPGRAFAAAPFIPGATVAIEYEDFWEDMSRVARGERSQAEFVDSRVSLRSLRFDLNSLEKEDRNTLREIIRRAGISQQILIVLRPLDADAGREVIIGRRRQNSPIRHRILDLYANSWTIGESA
jgi:hypothetical protein